MLLCPLLKYFFLSAQEGELVLVVRAVKLEGLVSEVADSTPPDLGQIPSCVSCLCKI